MSNLKKRINRRNEALKRLSSSVQEFNIWRASNTNLYIDLSKKDFTGKDLSNINFSGVKLNGSSFKNCTLNHASFIGANLNYSDFSDSICENSDFSQARLYKANFTNANLNDVNFYSALKEEIILKNVKCNSCWITKSKIKHSDFPDVFQEGEFELIYGGKRFKVAFQDGMEPIDLISLPFYIKQIMDKFKGKKVIFLGLSTIGEPCLEFRVDSSHSMELNTIQNEFNDTINAFRNDARFFCNEYINHLKCEIDKKEDEIKRKDEFNFKFIENVINKRQINTYIINNYEPSVINYHFVVKDLNNIRNYQKLNNSQIELLNKMEEAALSKDEKKLVHLIENAGKWLLDVATQVGSNILVNLINCSR